MVSWETAWHKKLPAFPTYNNTNFRCFSYNLCLLQLNLFTREVKIGIAVDAVADAMHQSGPP